MIEGISDSSFLWTDNFGGLEVESELVWSKLWFGFELCALKDDWRASTCVSDDSASVERHK